MSHRVNVVLTDEIWNALQDIPKGERSALINEAVAGWIELRGRRKAAAELDRLRATASPAPGRSEDWVRQDRESH